MRRIWVAAVMALAWVVMASDARADTVYLKDGQSIWGMETYEEGDTLVVVRPGGEVKVPRAQVSRIERTRSSLAPFYSPPGTGAASSGESPGTPGGGPPPGGSLTAPPRGPAPSPGGPTALPPAPTPPPPPGAPR